jgi:hypothetical protein
MRRRRAERIAGAEVGIERHAGVDGVPAILRSGQRREQDERCQVDQQ